MLNEIAKRIDTESKDGDAAMIRAVFAMFCKVPAMELQKPLNWLCKRWQATSGEHLNWHIIGADATRLSKSGSDALARVQFEIDAAASDRITSIVWQGPHAYAPEYRLSVLATDHVENPEHDWTAVVELTYPVPQTAEGWGTLLEQATAVSVRFPYDTAYISPVLFCGDEALEEEAGAIIGPIAMRHHGLDVADNRTTCYFLGRRTRGARWVTFVSHKLSSELDLATAKAKKDLNLHETANGIQVIASPVPEIGDTNRGVDTPGLLAAASLLEPISFFGDHNLASMFSDNQEMRETWERRFF